MKIKIIIPSGYDPEEREILESLVSVAAEACDKWIGFLSDVGELPIASEEKTKLQQYIDRVSSFNLDVYNDISASLRENVLNPYRELKERRQIAGEETKL